MINKCHRCGIEETKVAEKNNIYLAWQFGKTTQYKVIVWFHNAECCNIWKKKNNDVRYKEIKFADNTGMTKILTDENPDEFNDQNDTL